MYENFVKWMTQNKYEYREMNVGQNKANNLSASVVVNTLTLIRGCLMANVNNWSCLFKWQQNNLLKNLKTKKKNS